MASDDSELETRDRQDAELASRLEQLLEQCDSGEIPEPDLVEDVGPEMAAAIRGLAEMRQDLDLHVQTTQELVYRPAGELAMALAPAGRVGRFEVVECLGSGGQAVLFRAFDPDLQRHVALKIYHGLKMAGDHEAVLQEGRALARVESAYVARCFDAIRVGPGTMLVLELVRGDSIATAYERGQWTDQQLAQVLAQVCEGLAEVHASGLVHRDLKPDNILIDMDGQPRLVDFGLAHRVGAEYERDGRGTPGYMSPEQARCEWERIDARTDVFGVGAVLYRLLAGRPPYQGDSPDGVVARAKRGEFPSLASLRPHTHAELVDICERCMAADPKQRFDSAKELRARLIAWLEDVPKPNQTGRLTGSRDRWLAIAVVGLLMLAACSYGITRAWSGRGQTQLSAQRAVGPASPVKNDFELEATLVGGIPEANGAVVLRDNQRIQVRVASQIPSYISIWSIEGDAAVLLFPNQAEPESYLQANTPRVVPSESPGPGIEPLEIRARVSTADEYLHVVATSEKVELPEIVGEVAHRGDADGLNASERLYRGLELIRRKQQDKIRIAERTIRYRVLPLAGPAD